MDWLKKWLACRAIIFDFRIIWLVNHIIDIVYSRVYKISMITVNIPMYVHTLYQLVQCCLGGCCGQLCSRNERTSFWTCSVIEWWLRNTPRDSCAIMLSGNGMSRVYIHTLYYTYIHTDAWGLQDMDYWPGLLAWLSSSDNNMYL